MKKHLIIKTIIIFSLFTFSFNTKAANSALFNTVEFKSDKLSSIKKWTNLLDKMVIENKDFNTCQQDIDNCNNLYFKDWLEFIDDTSKIDDKVEQLDTVNQFFNNWEYILDIDNWGVTDYWEIPKEFLEFAGDCEDYAIIKYYTLKKLGFKVDDLRVVIVKDTVRNGAHAVLAAYYKDNIYILDNLSTIALTDDLLTQYQPYYSINEYNKWIHFKKFKS